MLGSTRNEPPSLLTLILVLSNLLTLFEEHAPLKRIRSVSVKGDGEKEASEHRHLPSIPTRRSHLFTAAAADDAECPEG